MDSPKESRKNLSIFDVGDKLANQEHWGCAQDDPQPGLGIERGAVEQRIEILHKGDLSHKDDCSNTPEHLTVLQIVKRPLACCKRPRVQHIPELQEDKDAKENTHLVRIDIGIDTANKYPASVSLTSKIVE